MWIVLLFLLALCIGAGKAGVWLAFLGAILWALWLGTQGTGMIWPWPGKKQGAAKGNQSPIEPWEDATADAGWKYLIAARNTAEHWMMARWKSRGKATAGAWLVLLIALVSFCAGIVFILIAFWPHVTVFAQALSWLLDGLLFIGVGVAFFVYTARTSPSGYRSAACIIREDLHGEIPLLSQWQMLCGTVPLPYSLWRYLRFVIPVAAWAYHGFQPEHESLALDAVMGVALLYFAYILVDAAFDTLAALNAVEVCPCRSSFLARMVWEAQFMRMHYKPVWARIATWIGL